VTPTLELAKLALVTSRDEEEDEVDRGGTDSSNDTDATLVDDGPPRPLTLDTSNIPQSSGKTVLGKRPRDLDQQKSDMEIDSPLSQSPKDKDGFVMISTRKERSSPEAFAQGSSEAEASSSKAQLTDRDGDVRMSTPQKPAPPPRKRAEVSDSTMMFGQSF